MKILITGGAGYIGSELVGYLLAEGHEVTVVDSLLYGGDSLLRYIGDSKFRFEKMDVRDTTKLQAHLAWSDAILPLACLVGFPLCDKKPLEAVQVNFEVNKWIAENKTAEQLLIYPCTNSGYGTSKDGGVCTEESPLNPVSLYGKTKVDAENIFKQTENCVTLRLATVFGPSSRMRTDLLVNNFVLKAMKERVLVLYECEFMRNYVHIQDICRVFGFILDNWRWCKNQTYNVGNDSINMNKLQLAQKIQEYIPLEIIKAEFNSDPDVRDYVVSSQKIYRKGFECKHDLDSGIQEIIKAYKLIDEPWYANY